MTAVLAIGLTGSAPADRDTLLTARVEVGTEQMVGRNATSVALRPTDRCPSARRGLRFYRGRHSDWTKLRGGTPRKGVRMPRNCADARWLASVWQQRSAIARRTFEAWAEARRARLANPTAAICHVFGPYCDEALRVASCESGRGVHAVNGQYLGMFQMGSYARSRYGHGYTPLSQARAAYRYFVESGRDWSPWSCKP